MMSKMENPTKAEMKVILKADEFGIDAEDNEEFDIGYELEELVSYFVDGYFLADYAVEMTDEYGELTGVSTDVLGRAKEVVVKTTPLMNEIKRAKKFIEICEEQGLKSFEVVERYY